MNNLLPWKQLSIDNSYALNQRFDVETLIKSFVFGDEKKFKQWFISTQELLTVFNAEWLSTMKNLGLEIEHAYIFYRGPHMIADPHVDKQKNGDFSIALNWVLGVDDSEMVWFNPTDIAPRYNEYELGYYHDWPIDQLVETHRHCIGSALTAVRVDIPHTVITNKNRRVSISVRTRRRTTSWDQVADIISTI